MRFGLMQTKIGIISFISNYEVRKTKETPKRLALEHRGIILTAADGVWLKIVNRQDRTH
jgi:hypothetical protein